MWAGVLPFLLHSNVLCEYCKIAESLMMLRRFALSAGIIGLCIAHELLANNLSVALVERQVPCAGATGAGTAACLK